MNDPVTRDDLVARALNALPEDDRARVDAAIEADEALRLEFEAVAGHLLHYDALPDAPPPPPFERIAKRMDADADPDLRVLRLGEEKRLSLWIPAGAAAAVAAAFVLLWLWMKPPDRTPQPDFTVGDGMSYGRSRPAFGEGEVTYFLFADDGPAEAHIGDRVRVVLEDAQLWPLAENRVALDHRGRAWFEVKPGEKPFVVETLFGKVTVLGTSFEVDLREEDLRVTVEEGRVRVQEVVVPAGHAYSQRAGRMPFVASTPGSWFRLPSLAVDVRGPVPTVNKPLELALTLRNATHLDMPLEGPGSARTPVWLRFESAKGELLGELPVLPANVITGAELLDPRGSVVLAPGSSKVLAVRILPPFASPGAYRCTALYRPEGQAPVLSSPLQIEVR